MNKEKRARRRLHVVGGKGGVGKSTLARALAWYWRSLERPFCAFDGDGSNATLARFVKAAQVVDVDGDGLVKRWFERTVVPALLESAYANVLLDLGAGAERLFRGWAADNNAPALLAEEGVSIVVWHLLDPSVDSISPMLETIIALPDVDHIIVLNHGLAKGVHAYEPEAAFSAIQDEPEFQQAARGRPLVRLPPLVDGATLDAQDLDFIVAASDSGPLTIFERLRVRKWLSNVETQVRPWL